MDEQAQATGSPEQPYVLDAIQARVLGCLIEKEATTPETYPLTVNATQVAANQKTAREPVMSLDPGKVQHALRELERLGLARQHFSSRADRYAHRATEALDVTQQQASLLGLLLLRGPQTVHELLARSERLSRFEDADDAKHHLERLIQRELPLVVQLPRGAGQREDRYMHLLSGEVDVEAIAAHVVQPETCDASGGGTLSQRVIALEEAMAVLRERLDALERGG